MALPPSLNLVDLDFASRKAALRNYLKSQDQFAGYDFDSANMDVLLDLLTYNTVQNAFYLNMAISEGFLDSAQLRNSIASHAKELNYLPRSNRSGKARVRVSFTASGDNQPYTIPKGVTFTSQVKNENFTFSLAETVTVSSENTSFTFDADIYEGVYIKDVFLVRSTTDVLSYKLSDRNIDTTSISISVYEDGAGTGQEYVFATSMLGLNESSKIFFLQPRENGFYEIVFGNGVIGKKPKLHSKIVVDYRVSETTGSNGARMFVANFDPTNASGDSELLSIPVVSTLLNATGAAERETIESVRYTAPRHFQVQERAITASDYEIMLKAAFPEIQAVAVYGGEEANPPKYGYIYIAVDIENVDGLPDSKIQEYYSFIKKRNTGVIEPIFISPDYLYLSINATVKYNINVTDKSPERIKTILTDTIHDYKNMNLDDFKAAMRYSKLLKELDSSDTSIISLEMDVYPYKKFAPELSVAFSRVIDFGFPLSLDYEKQSSRYLLTEETVIFSSQFTCRGQAAVLGDDGNGVLRVLKIDENYLTKMFDVGTVDYTNGSVAIRNLTVDNFIGDGIKIYCISAKKDIETTRNTILTVDSSDINVTVEKIRL